MLLTRVMVSQRANLFVYTVIIIIVIVIIIKISGHTLISNTPDNNKTTKEINVQSVWKSAEKLLVFAPLISPSKIILFEK